MAEAALFHEEQARGFFGREIPHILLIHANALNAAELDALLTWFEKNGYMFITLWEALQDECYKLPEATTPHGFSWIRHWQLAAGQKPPWPPEIQPEVQKRYDALRRRASGPFAWQRPDRTDRYCYVAPSPSPCPPQRPRN